MGLFKREKKLGHRKGPMGLNLAPNRSGPMRTADQDSPEQERLTRPDEEAGMAVHQLKNPPKAEG